MKKEFRCNYCGAPIEGLECNYCKQLIDNNLLEIKENKDNWYSIISNKIKNGEHLTQEESDHYRDLLDYRLVPFDPVTEECVLYNMFMGNKVIYYDAFESFIEYYTEGVIKQAVNTIDKKTYNPIVEIKPENELPDGWKACTLGNSILYLNETYVNSIYTLGNIVPLKTILHETAHIIQNTLIELGYVNSDIMMIIKDSIIRHSQMYEDYYPLNYLNTSYEINAENVAVELTKQFIDRWHLDTPDLEDYSLNVGDIKNYKRIVLVEGEKQIAEINDLCDEVLRIHPEFLDMYKQLDLEYTSEDGNVRRKNTDELIETIGKYENNEYVKNYLQELIDKSNKKSML